MSEDAVKLIGECSRDRLPSYVERLIVDVKQELGDSLTDYDLTVVILFALMAETGFTPLAVDDKLTGPMSPYGSTYDSQKLKAIQKMPKNWRAANGSSYSMKFHLNPCHDSVCQFLASKIEAGTNTVSIDDNLIVNLFVSCSPTAKAVHIQPSRYVASKSAPIPAMFDKLDELSLLFKNVVHPLRNTILEENGKLNASLVGIPTEVKLKIFQYLSVPAGWKALSETCMDMHILGNDPKLWKSYVKRDFGSIANHKASVEELCRTTKDVDWKTEYMGRYFYKLLKRQLVTGCPETRLVITASGSLIEEEITPKAQPAAAVSTQESDAWKSPVRQLHQVRQVRQLHQARRQHVDVAIDATERWSRWQYSPEDYFEDEDVMQRFSFPMDTPSPTPSVEVLYFAAEEEAFCEESYDSAYESDDLDGNKPFTSFAKGTLRDKVNEDEANVESGMYDSGTRDSGPMSSTTGTLRGSGASTRRSHWLGPCTSVMYRYDVRGRKRPFSGAEAVKNSWACTSLASWVGPDDTTRFNNVCNSTDFKNVSSTHVQTAKRDANRDPESWTSVIGVRSVHSSPELQDYNSLKATNYGDSLDEVTPQALEYLGIEAVDVDDADRGIFMEIPLKSVSLPLSEGSGLQDSSESDLNLRPRAIEECVGLPLSEGSGLQDSSESDLYLRPRAIEECVGLPLSEEVSGAHDPFEHDLDDVDAVSMQNHMGSEPDLVCVMREVERNGNGDAGYLEGVVPTEYTYKEVRPGEPYV